jgi:hypothetical protein
MPKLILQDHELRLLKALVYLHHSKILSSTYLHQADILFNIIEIFIIQGKQLNFMEHYEFVESYYLGESGINKKFVFHSFQKKLFYL